MYKYNNYLIDKIPFLEHGTMFYTIQLLHYIVYIIIQKNIIIYLMCFNSIVSVV